MSTPVCVPIKWTKLTQIPSNSLSESTPAPFLHVPSQSLIISPLLQIFNTLLLLLLWNQDSLIKIKRPWVGCPMPTFTNLSLVNLSITAYILDRYLAFSSSSTPQSLSPLGVCTRLFLSWVPILPPHCDHPFILNDCSVFRSHLTKHFLRKAFPAFSNYINSPSQDHYTYHLIFLNTTLNVQLFFCDLCSMSI